MSQVAKMFANSERFGAIVDGPNELAIFLAVIDPKDRPRVFHAINQFFLTQVGFVCESLGSSVENSPTRAADAFVERLEQARNGLIDAVVSEKSGAQAKELLH